MNWKDIIIIALVLLLMWGGGSNVFRWNVETVTETHTVTDTLYITDTVAIPKPYPVVRDRVVYKLPLANPVRTFTAEPNIIPVYIDSASVVLPVNVYADSLEHLTYSIMTEGYLREFVYRVKQPHTTTITTITNTKQPVWSLNATAGTDGLGVQLMSRRYGVGASTDLNQWTLRGYYNLVRF